MNIVSDKFNGDYSQLPFGKESTPGEIALRIAFEWEAAGIARQEGNKIMVEAHTVTACHYVELLKR